MLGPSHLSGTQVLVKYVMSRNGSVVGNLWFPDSAARLSLNSAAGRRCIHKRTKAIKRGQAVEVAKPSRRDDQSDVTPTSHGIRIPPIPEGSQQPKHRGTASGETVRSDT